MMSKQTFEEQTARRPYNGEEFTPIGQPCADNDELAETGERVIVYRERTGPGWYRAVLFIAPKGVLCAGFVIGIIPAS